MRDSTNENPLSTLNLLLALLCPSLVIYLSHRLRLNIEKKIFIGLIRCTIQLLLLGYVLLGFLFSTKSILLIALYIFFMIIIAAIEITNRQVRTYKGHLCDSFLACLLGGGLFGLYGAFAVVRGWLWWDPKVIIPTVGMVIGNAVPGPSVAVDRLLSEVTDKKHEIEVRLAFDATGQEAMLHPLQDAMLAAMMPKLNLMSVIGIVSIPGMMTSQLMGGATPFVAAKYQMVIIFLGVAATAMASYTATMFVVKHAVLDDSDRLTPERIIKKASGKLSLDAAIMKSLLNLGEWLWLYGRNMCCIFQLCPRFEQETRTPGLQYSVLSNSDVLNETKFQIENDSSARIENGLNVDSIVKVKMSIIDNVPTISHDVLHQLKPQKRKILSIKGLNVRSGEIPLFFDTGIDLDISIGEIITVEGQSGIGKTRLIRALAQLDNPLSGSMTFLTGKNEQATVKIDDKSHTPDKTKIDLKYTAWRKQIIYVPQAVPPLAGTPLELIEECLNYRCRKQFISMSNDNFSTSWRNMWFIRCFLPSVLEQQAQHLTSILGKKDISTVCRAMELGLLLDTGKMDSSWSSLSGGERQRAIIACGIILSGAFSRDEPTAACDAKSCEAVESVILDCGAAAVIITHDTTQAQRLAHRRILLSPI